MNRNYYIKRISALLLLFSVISLSSCKKFLETRQYDRSNDANFYKTLNDFDQGVIGVLAVHREIYRMHWLLTDMRSDNTSVYSRGGARGPLSKSDFDNFFLTANTEHINTVWISSYTIIGRCNDLLGHLENADIPQASKDQFTGELKALRAASYFNLVRFFGGVPLVLESFANIDDSYQKQRDSEEAIYTQILSDLTSAIPLLPVDRNTGANTGRVDKAIAHTLLADVYLTRKDFPKAAAEFKKVIDMNQYDLLPEYLTLWETGQQGNKETIWQIYFLKDVAGAGSSFPSYFAPLNSQNVLLLPGTGNPFGWNSPTNDIFNAYDPTDKRREAIAEGFTGQNGEYYDFKYMKTYVNSDFGTGDGRSGSDWYVYRYADVLLRYAEALNEVEGPDNAYQYINQVRARAGLDDLSGLTKDEFREAVYEEERLESPFEGKRWFDLNRTGRTLQVMNAKLAPDDDPNTVGPSIPISEHHKLLPIPTVIMASAPALTQNPGY